MEGNLSKDKLFPGQMVGVDHFVCSTKGRLYSSAGKSPSHQMFSGGALFVDYASRAVYVKHQVGMSTHETLASKYSFEEWFKDMGHVPQNYQSDNASCFTSKEYINHLKEYRQIQQFAGVGAHHHNAQAERAIQTIMSMARTMMLHAAIRWPDSADAQLWPMCVDHAVYLYNRLPNPETGLSPMEILTGTKWPAARFLDIHVWGCPTYVLDPTLQEGKKIPKWKPRSRRGVYLGVSKHHSSSAPMILNLHSGKISQQYHCIFDDWFTTVGSHMNDESPIDPDAAPWNDLFAGSRFQYPFDDDQVVPSLSDDWLDYEKFQLQRDALRTHRDRKCQT